MNFRAGSTFIVPVCTVLSSIDRTSRCNKVDAVIKVQFIFPNLAEVRAKAEYIKTLGSSHLKSSVFKVASFVGNSVLQGYSIFTKYETTLRGLVSPPPSLEFPVAYDYKSKQNDTLKRLKLKKQIK